MIDESVKSPGESSATSPVKLPGKLPKKSIGQPFGQPTIAIAAIALTCVVGGTSACNRNPEFSGIGNYRFGRTTLGDITDGRCEPTDIAGGTRKATWCFALTPLQIANRTTQLDLYFDGTEKTAPLIEIQLSIRGCVEEDLRTWMRTNFGAPIETKPHREYWQNSYLWASAKLPSEPGRCLVQLLPLGETTEIARIKNQ